MVEGLRREADSILKCEEDWWNASSFPRLIIADSVIRESLRYHPILIKGLTKEVVPAAGLRLPAGAHMPKGSWIGIPVLGIHRDERYYKDAADYQPYRFVHTRPKDDTEKRMTWEDEMQAAKPTTTYLGFGYGRHAW